MLDALVMVLQFLLVISIPFFISHGGEIMIHWIAHHEFAEIPILTTLARLQGLLLGGLLLYVNFDDSYYDLQTLFLPDSRWNLTFYEFLLERSNLFNYQFWPLIDMMREIPHERGVLAVLAVALIPLMLGVLSIRFWAWREALRSMLACAGTAMWSAWLTLYLVCLAFWSLYLLNFWSLAVAALYYQYQRTHSH